MKMSQIVKLRRQTWANLVYHLQRLKPTRPVVAATCGKNDNDNDISNNHLFYKTSEILILNYSVPTSTCA